VKIADMDTKLILAIVTITMALIFYTAGVWSEHRQKQLRAKNLILFWIGLVFDTTGTTIMTTISNLDVDANRLNLHGITGAAAILLMIVHAVWATIVLATKNEKAQHTFHRFSVTVWCIWLVPYILGMIMGMR
jgi:uncharacterized repeat protein (TIGR03987 family)